MLCNLMPFLAAQYDIGFFTNQIFSFEDDKMTGWVLDRSLVQYFRYHNCKLKTLLLSSVK